MPIEDDKGNGVAAFIEDLELSAKRILKAANKKRREDKRIEQSVAIMQGKKVKGVTDKKEKEFVFSSTLPEPSKGKLLGTPQEMTHILSYSVPAMSVSMSQNSDVALDSSLGSTGPTKGYLSPIKQSMLVSKSAEFGGSAGFGDSKKASVAPTKRNFTLEKLQASPFLPGNETLDEMLVNLKGSRRPTSGGNGPTMESAWELKLHAADVLGGKTSSSANVMHKKLLKKKAETRSLVSAEPSGLTDWTYKGLKSKYRGEREREELYNSWLSASSLSTLAFEMKDYVVPVVPVQRHPMIARYEALCEKENWHSTMRTRKRLVMKRFVLDVREVWLTNLQHIKEHSPENVLLEDLFKEQAPLVTSEQQGEDGDDRSWLQNSTRLHEHDAHEDKSMKVSEDGGLHRRRDSRAILGMDHQVQSVAFVRATEQAYHPAALFDCKLVLDFEPEPTPYLVLPDPLPPVLELLISNFAVPSKAFEAEPHLPYRPPGVHIDSDVMVSISRLCPSLEMLNVIDRLEEQVKIMNGEGEGNGLMNARKKTKKSKVEEPRFELTESDLNAAVGDGTALEVWWRIDLIRRNDVRTVEYYAREGQVASYVAEMLVAHQSPQSQGPSPSSAFVCDPVMVFESSSCSLPSYLSDGRSNGIVVADIIVSVALKAPRDGRSTATAIDPGMSMARLEECRIRDVVDIEVRALLSGTQREVGVLTNPAELGAVLEYLPARSADFLWWVDPSRSHDMWPALCLNLFVELLDDALPEGPCSLQVKRLPSAGDVVSGALSLSEALSCAHELTNLLSVAVDKDSGDLVLCLPGAERGADSHLFSKRLSPSPLPPAPPITPSILRLVDEPKSHKSKKTKSKKKASSKAESKDEDDESALVAMDAIGSEILLTPPWEMQTGRNESSLTMQVNGGLALRGRMLGSCDHGKKGLWFGPPKWCPTEYTQAAAIFNRDPYVSSTNSVMVLLSLALDTPMQFGTVIAWESFQTFPPRSQFEVIQDTVPSLISIAKTQPGEPLISPIDQRLSQRAMVFITTADEGFDYIPLDSVVERKTGRGSGMRRHIPYINDYGYRQKIEVLLVGVDPVISTSVFGLTQFGALPNIPGVNNRSIWHGSLAIVEHINRPRVPTDYHYILVSFEAAGENDACAFCVKLSGSEFVGIVPTASKAFQAEYTAIDERRAVYARQLALDAKIENSEMNLRIRDREIKNSIQQELQRALEKKLRKGTRSEKGWAKRYHSSTLMEVQGCWERRRDDRSGMMFFHKIDAPGAAAAAASSSRSGKGGKVKLNREQYLQTCQWEVPSAWDGEIQFGDARGAKQVDALRAQLQKLGGKDSTDIEEAKAFAEPDDTWLPGTAEDDHGSKPTFGVAPKFFHRPTKANMSNKLPKPFFNSDGTIRERTAGDADDVDKEELYDDAGSLDSSLVFSASLGGKSTVSGGGDSGGGEGTVGTLKLQHIAEQLVSSDDLVRVLAKRLGLPVSNIVPAEDMDSVYSKDSVLASIDDSMTGSGAGIGDTGVRSDTKGAAGRLMAPRFSEADDFLSDSGNDSEEDIWSDDEVQAGDEDEEEADVLPTDYGEMALIKKKIKKAEAAKDQKPTKGVHIPFLNLLDNDLSSKENGDNKAVAQWRRLPRPDISANFFAKCTQRRTIGPDEKAANTLNAPVALVPLNPVDAVQYVPDPFPASYSAIFIPNAKKDMERQLATLARNISKEEILGENIPTDDLLLFGEPTENTRLDAHVMKQFKEDQSVTKDAFVAAIDKALWAAKGGNIAEIEDALEEQIPVDTCDQFGNSLLLLAAQQGSKRMVKFLLRRGANMDWQNTSGNTAMHYCYAYNNPSLGDYLKSRGANDQLLNVDGMTCYEGLSKEYLKAPGDPDSEPEDEDVEQLEWHA